MTENINLTDALKKYFGFDTFKGNQEAIIRNLLAGNDTFVLMPTGGGKSLCYQLPSLIMDGTAIVISPLIALMKNQVDAMRNFSEEDGVAHFINSSLNKSAIDQVKSDILSGKTKLLYVAPESLTKEENVDFLKGVKISFYAVDEAHCISEWGHDFRPEYRRIRPIINEIGKAPVIALTATATPKVRMDIQKNLGMQDAQEFKSSFNRPNLYYEVRSKTNNIDRDIIKFIKANPGKSGIIYCLSRKKVEELAEVLQANGINARAYHAGMDSATRTANQDGFLKEDIDVIVATIAFGMGIDKPDVRFVIHYDIPKSLEGYYQETGRAGRDVPQFASGASSDRRRYAGGRRPGHRACLDAAGGVDGGDPQLHHAPRTAPRLPLFGAGARCRGRLYRAGACGAETQAPEPGAQMETAPAVALLSPAGKIPPPIENVSAAPTGAALTFMDAVSRAGCFCPGINGPCRRERRFLPRFRGRGSVPLLPSGVQARFRSGCGVHGWFAGNVPRWPRGCCARICHGGGGRPRRETSCTAGARRCCRGGSPVRNLRVPSRRTIRRNR